MYCVSFAKLGRSFGSAHVFLCGLPGQWTIRDVRGNERTSRFLLVWREKCRCVVFCLSVAYWKRNRLSIIWSTAFLCTQTRGRTGMEVNPLVFETSASTDSAIWANCRTFVLNCGAKIVVFLDIQACLRFFFRVPWIIFFNLLWISLKNFSFWEVRGTRNRRIGNIIPYFAEKIGLCLGSEMLEYNSKQVKFVSKTWVIGEKS